MSAPANDLAGPREWLNRARSSLEHARATHPKVYFEELCFDAQQAAEKAVKAVLLGKGIAFPYVHDLDALLRLLATSGEPLAGAVIRAGELRRYPGLPGHVSEQEYREALALAESVVQWAETVLLSTEKQA